MTNEELLAEVQKAYPQAAAHAVPVKPYVTLKASKEELLPLVQALAPLGFDYLDMVTAVDWKGPVAMAGYIVDPNPNHFLPEGAGPEEPPKPTPGFPYRDAFELVYLLTSFAKQAKLAVKVEVPRAEASVPSLAGTFAAANWQEREVFDLFGIRFEGHPNLQRILTPDFIQGHPLRKDYVHTKDLYD